MANGMHILVLGGGPDRERPVSFRSAACVAAALREAGHRVTGSDITPGDLSALNTRCEAIFPVLHGQWGEGGPLQRLLDETGRPYVGSDYRASRTAIDKLLAKQTAERIGVPTPAAQQLGPTATLDLDPPVVLKPLTEGSSFDIYFCQTAEDVAAAREELHAHHAFILAERCVSGRELTVGILDADPLPVIEIVAATDFYDYEAKYDRSDTQYRFEIDLPDETITMLAQQAVDVHLEIGCRHVSRVDFLVDEAGRPWFLEINTMPGFTDHSLVPKAAAEAGLAMPALCDRLVRLAMGDPHGR